MELPPALRFAVVARLKIMADLDISEHRKPQDGKIDFARFGGPHVELRVVTVPTSRGLEDVVLRLLSGLKPMPLDDIGLSPANLRALREVAQAGTDDPQVPRLPSVLPRLMRLVRRDDFSVRELAGLLASEPALLGEVMRLANAPAHRGSAAPLASLEAAVSLLGQAGMQAVLARAVMAPVFGVGHGRLGAKAATMLWELAGRCAEACARQCPPDHDPFEARLAGMVSCTGWLVAVRLLDRQATGEALCGLAFHDQLAREATRLSARIARSWRLPEGVVQAVEALDRPAGEASPGSLAAVLRQADRAVKADAAQVGLGRTAGT